MNRIDPLDRDLIAILRRDGRAPISKLATLLHVSRATVQARLDRLLDNGAILGFTARVREGADGSTIRAIMAIEVVGRSTQQVIKALQGLPELYSLHSTNGAWDLIAEIRTQSLQDFDRVLRLVRETDGVLNSETSILLTSV